VLLLFEAEMKKTLKRVHTHKATSPDSILDCVLRVCADQLAGVFLDIFNMSLLQAVVPSCFKETTIIPVPKKKQGDMPK
jgi:hypothetical protein